MGQRPARGAIEQPRHGDKARVVAGGPGRRQQARRIGLELGTMPSPPLAARRPAPPTLRVHSLAQAEAALRAALAARRRVRLLLGVYLGWAACAALRELAEARVPGAPAEWCFDPGPRAGAAALALRQGAPAVPWPAHDRRRPPLAALAPPPGGAAGLPWAGPGPPRAAPARPRPCGGRRARQGDGARSLKRRAICAGLSPFRACWWPRCWPPPPRSRPTRPTRCGISMSRPSRPPSTST